MPRVLPPPLLVDKRCEDLHTDDWDHGNYSIPHWMVEVRDSEHRFGPRDCEQSLLQSEKDFVAVDDCPKSNWLLDSHRYGAVVDDVVAVGGWVHYSELRYCSDLAHLEYKQMH